MAKIRTNKPFELVGVTSEKYGYEESAKKIFEILVYHLPAGVTDRVMELYKLWDEYTDDWSHPMPDDADEFFEILKKLEEDVNE